MEDNAVFKALDERRFFKLICGGSFSDTHRLKQLIGAYVEAGVTAVDVSASLAVTEAAIEALQTQHQKPMLMVSFPLDSDPHFRKIELKEEDCISCGVCLPVCPTNVFTLPSPQDSIPLLVDGPACYGCGRCVPVCPTEALHLDPFSVMSDLANVLSKPQVKAVEIHSLFCDPAMIDMLYQDIGHLLSDKIISVCFCPDAVDIEKALLFVEKLSTKTTQPLIIQIDGVPMSGSDDPKASIPALEAARKLADRLPHNSYLTISGGINAETAHYLKESRYQPIHGVGMGTYARKWVWDSLDEPTEALSAARTLVSPFVAVKTPQPA